MVRPSRLGSETASQSVTAASTVSEMLESITWDGQPLCHIIRRERFPVRTVFVTPAESTLQVGYVVYEGGREIPRHVHRRIERTIDRTAEVLVVRMGRAELDVYTDDQKLVTTREVREGDVIIFMAGGHGFRMVEDTVLLEVKQGPYSGTDEKIRF